jgi:hypothetical protein
MTMKRIASYFDWLPLTLSIITITTALTVMPGCPTTPHITDNPGVVQAGFTEAETLINNAKQEIALLDAKQASGQPLSPDEAATLARTKAWINSTAVLLANAQAGAAAANRVPDAGDVITGLTPLLPPPFNIIGGIVGGAISESWRTRKKRKSFDALVGAMNTVKKKNTGFADALDAAGPELRSEMGTSAKTEIDKMRGFTKMNALDRVRNF